MKSLYVLSHYDGTEAGTRYDAALLRLELEIPAPASIVRRAAISNPIQTLAGHCELSAMPTATGTWNVQTRNLPTVRLAFQTMRNRPDLPRSHAQTNFVVETTSSSQRSMPPVPNLPTGCRNNPDHRSSQGARSAWTRYATSIVVFVPSAPTVLVTARARARGASRLCLCSTLLASFVGATWSVPRARSIATAWRLPSAAERVSVGAMTRDEPSPILTGSRSLRSHWLQIRECNRLLLRLDKQRQAESAVPVAEASGPGLGRGERCGESSPSSASN